MKKLSFFLMAMLFSVMSYAAESLQVTLDFSKNTTWRFPNGSSAKTTTMKTYTNGDYSITLAGGGNGNGHYWNNQGYLIFGKSGATLTLPAFDFKTTKIVVTGRSGASASVLQNIYVGGTAVSDQTKGAEVTNTYEIAEDYQAAGNVYVLKVTSSHNTQIVKMEIYGEEGGEQGEKVDAPTFSVTETNFNKAFDLTISSAEGTTLKYTTDNTDPKTSATAVSVKTNTANVSIPAKSTAVKAVAVKGDLVSVTSSIVYAYVNSAETAYTVAEAMEVIDAGLGLDNELYIKGTISKIESFNSQYGSITYWIEDEEGNEFECYSGLGLNKAKFTSIEDVEVGASVVACGVMKLFVTSSGDKIYEFNYNNYLVEYVAPVVNHTITVSANPAEAGTVTGGGEFEETDEITVKAVANDGYEFVNWTENEVEVSDDAEYTFEVLADRNLVANFKEAEPVYQVIEDEITNFVFDMEAWPMVCLGGPSANYQIDVFLVLTEDADGTLSYEDCSVSIMGTDATFIEGTLSNLDPYAPSADAVLRVQWNEEFYELHLAMSAAAAEPIVVVVENATLDDQVESTGFFYMAGECTIDGVTYPVKAEIPGFDKTKAEAEYENVMVEVGTWGGEYLGNATGTATISVVDNVVTLSGVIENPMTHVAFDVTISGTLPVVEEPETPDPENPDTPTSVDNVEATVAPVKVIENGQLIIVKEGVQYNAQGAILK